MRRAVATLLVSALLSSATPSFARRDDGDRFDPIKVIKKIIRILVPSPDDDSVPTPPKP
ncbi:MAG TPA: hypothetical protein VER58_00250 [Thermoanaerobaculia bacterium]|nr:hypothetical protein [Thermoanaerobaculia bacterium]